MTLLSRCVWCLSYSNGTSGVEGSLLWLLNDSCGQMVHLAQYIFTPMALSPSSLKKPLFNAACYWCEASIGTFKNVTLNVCGESVVAGIAAWDYVPLGLILKTCGMVFVAFARSSCMCVSGKTPFEIKST